MSNIEIPIKIVCDKCKKSIRRFACLSSIYRADYYSLKCQYVKQLHIIEPPKGWQLQASSHICKECCIAMKETLKNKLEIKDQYLTHMKNPSYIKTKYSKNNKK